jgi:hypothetical protein
MERNELLARARHAYERGRVRLALRTLLLTVPMGALSVGCCQSLVVSVGLGGLLVVASALLVWRGGVGGRAVTSGLLAGVAPVVLPLAMRAGCSISGVGLRYCLSACALGGVIAGAVIWVAAMREKETRKEFVLVAGTVATVAGALGCVVLGVSGVVAMTVALAALSAPAMLRQARASG